jgi:ABC-type Fe3+/spermidine/putrescine transport system ATPase subunit
MKRIDDLVHLIDRFISFFLWNGNKCGKTGVMRILKQPSSTQIIIDQKEVENVESFNY